MMPYSYALVSRATLKVAWLSMCLRALSERQQRRREVPPSPRCHEWAPGIESYCKHHGFRCDQANLGHSRRHAPTGSKRLGGALFDWPVRFRCIRQRRWPPETDLEAKALNEGVGKSGSISFQRGTRLKKSLLNDHPRSDRDSTVEVFDVLVEHADATIGNEVAD